MKKTRKFLATLAIAGLTAAPLGTAEAFWGFWPGSWFVGHVCDYTGTSVNPELGIYPARPEIRRDSRLIGQSSGI